MREIAWFISVQLTMSFHDMDKPSRKTEDVLQDYRQFFRGTG